MRCSHASSQKLIDWLVRCHGQAGEAARVRERQRGGEKDMATVGWKMRRLYVCVGGLEGRNPHMYVHTQLANSGLVLVSCPWPRRAQESAVSLWRIDTDGPLTLRPDTTEPPPPSLSPSSLLPPSFFSSSQPMPRGHVWEETYRGGEASLCLDCGLHYNMPSCHPHSASLLASYLLAMLATVLWSFYHFI